MPRTCTVGIPVYNDLDGLYFTVMSLIAHNDVSNWELVVVDSTPPGPARDAQEKFINRLNQFGQGIKYVPMSRNIGSAPCKNRCVKEASGEVFLGLDAHVLLPSNALQYIETYFSEQPEDKNIHSGPIVYDNDNCSTHLHPYWRGTAFGIWADMWRLNNFGNFVWVGEDESGKEKLWQAEPVGETPDHFGAWESDLQKPEGANWISILQPIATKVGWGGSEVYKIPGMGMGMYFCRKDAWPKFQKDMLGFGAEEIIISEKTRQAGGHHLSHSRLWWRHRFPRIQKPGYPISNYGKMRNYILGLNELKKDITPIFDHFVTGEKKVSERDWVHCLSNTREHVTKAPPENSGLEVGQTDWSAFDLNMDEIGKIIREQSPIPEILAEIDKRIDQVLIDKGAISILEQSDHRDTSVAIMSKLVDEKHVEFKSSTSKASDPAYKRSAEQFHHFASCTDPDIVVIHSVDNRDDLKILLGRYLGARFIIVAKTLIYRNWAPRAGKDGRPIPGLNAAFHWLFNAHPNWSVLEASPVSPGFVTLGSEKRDKPQLPPYFEMAANLASAAAGYAQNWINGNSVLATPEVYQKRLEICQMCPLRNDGECSGCGCIIKYKARLAAPVGKADCPLGKWRDIEAAKATNPPANQELSDRSLPSE